MRSEAEELTRAQLCFALNSHSLASVPLDDLTFEAEPEAEPEPESESDLLTTSLAEHGLFLQGSRLTHACAGAENTAYHCIVDRRRPGCAAASAAAAAATVRGEHRALRTIGVGEVLLSNYCGARGICARPTRRAYLRSSYLFDCVCAACTSGGDLARALPCPACAPVRDPATGLLPASPDEGVAPACAEPCIVPSPEHKCVDRNSGLAEIYYVNLRFVRLLNRFVILLLVL
jgi:hypothetical protein